MKLNKFFFGILAAGMLVSCSDNGVETAMNSVSPDAAAFDADGNAYVKVSLNLKSNGGGMKKAATRADGKNYGDFNDGDENEYTVENAYICIFSDENASSELDYKMIGTYELSAGDWKDDTETQVTQHREFIKQINNAGSTGNLYAYVILNKHDFFKLVGKDLYFNSGREGESDIKMTGETLATFSTLSIKESGRRYDANSFMMTNMPYANKAGGSQDPKGLQINTLYPLTGHIYPTLVEANDPDNKGAEVNVERVLAKVEVHLADGEQQTEFNPDHKFKFLGWFVDNTNPNSYVGRHTSYNGSIAYHELLSSVSTYRFVEEKAISATQSDRFRTYWAIDPNYDERADVPGIHKLINEGGAAVDNTFMSYDEKGENVGGRLRPTGTHYYCTENTFDVAHQSVSNTTRVIVAAQFVNKDTHEPQDFYTIENEPNVMYYEQGILDYAKARIANRDNFKLWAVNYLKAGVNAAKCIDIELSNSDMTKDLKAGLITVTVNETPKDLTATDIQDGKTLQAAKDAYALLIADHNDYLADNCEVSYYKGGVSYYQALIKHFGDEETPWNKEAHNGKPNQVNDIYDSLDDAKYLGRYGVVRNNWYILDVDGVRQIGSPIVPEVPGKDPLDPDDPDTPDDQVESYLKVKINIMPWVIRKQGVTLF